MYKSTNDLLLELNKIEEERIKAEEKQKQINKRIKLEKEAENLKSLLEQQEKEKKRLDEEETLKKQNDFLKKQIEELKNKKIELSEEDIKKSLNLNTSYLNNNSEEKRSVVLTNSIKQKRSLINKIALNTILVFIGMLLSLFIFDNLYKDDNVHLILEKPKIVYLTEVIEKEVIVEKEVKQVINTKPLVTKQITNTKPQQNITPTVTKPKTKCPINDPLCGIF